MSKVSKLTPEERAQLQAALEHITVHDVWRLLKLNGHQRVPTDGSDYACCSPLREDRSPSFSLFDGGRRWKDHGEGDTGHGDSVDFIERALGVPREIASRLIIGLAREGRTNGSISGEEGFYNPFGDQKKAGQRANWPALETPTEEETETIATLRGISPEGVALAAQRKFLYCADSQEGRAWVIHRQPPQERPGQKARRQAVGAQKLQGVDLARKRGNLADRFARGARLPSHPSC